MLNISKLSQFFNQQHVLNEVSFDLNEGEIGCILGPSGAGKTTLLRCIAGFEKSASGRIKIDNKIVDDSNNFIPPEHRKVGFVFQEDCLFPHLSVFHNITFGLKGASMDEKHQITLELLKLIDLERLRNRLPHELSGGQKQRIALARALALKPKLILLDEPFSDLDPQLNNYLKREVKALFRHFNATALLVTHNQTEAFDLADSIGVLCDGKIEQWADAYNLYHFPATQSVAEFVGESSFLPCDYAEDGMIESEIGKFKVSGIEVPKGKYKMLIRPENLIHKSAAPLRGEVREISFRGMYQTLLVRLPSGNDVLAWASGRSKISKGQTVGIKVEIASPKIFP